MDKALRPERFNADPNNSRATKSWIQRKRNFEKLFVVLMDDDVDKFGILTNYVSPTVFEYIEECTTYESPIETLQNIYVKSNGETLDEYLQALKVVSKECNFQSVTAAKYCEEYIRDSFITGFDSNHTR